MGITPADYNHLNGRFDESHGKTKKSAQRTEAQREEKLGEGSEIDEL